MKKNGLITLSTEELAMRLHNFLKSRPQINLKNPITSKRLIEFAKSSGAKITDSEIRAAVHYLISEKHVFIGSTLSGYFYTEDWREFKASLGHLYSRISELGERLRASEAAIEKRIKEEQHVPMQEALFEHPVLQAMERELGSMERRA